MQIIHKIREKMGHGLAFLYILDRLSAVDIGLRPFYLVLEGGQYIDTENFSVGIQPCEAGFLTKHEIKELASHPEVGHSEKELFSRIDRGCKCFGLKHHSDIVAYMWCDFSRCESWISFSLKPKEVYLFDARSFNLYRGNNLAPFLRDQLYKELRKIGCDKFYSVSDAFNTPAINFKRKLGAKNLKLFMHIRLFKKIQKNILLKEYVT